MDEGEGDGADRDRDPPMRPIARPGGTAARRAAMASPSSGSLPRHPFWPQYEGDEDTRRKPAYHNGTAWPWLMPMLAEAMAITFGDQGRTAGISLLGTAQKLFAQGALGNIAEILDAAIPHTPKGCGAQAWSVSELVRVLAKLQLE